MILNPLASTLVPRVVKYSTLPAFLQLWTGKNCARVSTDSQWTANGQRNREEARPKREENHG